ncbi:NAD(P)/FAD-dependent oxidoreductase [Dactylosporangium sp. NPDC000555]|uniref:phytoene desaturase family protein n=1 Tax=Dactylosporangium sp. NPDC000555 TaxID=3154260 RepID=UPI00332F2633
MSGGEYDVAIIGGGHNGLVAGTYLAKAGLRTVILEQRDIAGGLTAPVEYFPGYTASITNSPGSLEPRIVAELSLADFGLRFVRPDPSLTYPFPGGTGFIGWRDRGRSLDQIAKFSRRDAERYYPFFAYLEEFAARLRANIFEAPPPFATVIGDIADARGEEMLSKIMFGSVQDLLDEWFESDEVKALIASVAIVANLAGPRSPGTVMRLLARPLSVRSAATIGADDPRRQVLRGSTGIPIGGMGTIAVAMTRAFTAAGGQLRLGARVAQLVTENGRIRAAVTTSGEEFRARVVLSNVNPMTTLLDLLPPDALPDEVRDRAARLPLHGSAFKVGLALDGIPRFAMAGDDTEAELLAGCQFRIAPSLEYMERAFDDAKYGRPSHGPMLWGLTPSVSDPSVTPEGRHVMSVNVFHAPYDLVGTTWEQERSRFGMRCIDVLSEYIPNLKEIITDVRFWSPVDLESEYGLLRGNITHGDTLPAQMFSFRPLPGMADYRTPVQGLYLCGAGSWPGGSVTGVPGRNASMAVLADLAGNDGAAST